MDFNVKIGNITTKNFKLLAADNLYFSDFLKAILYASIVIYFITKLNAKNNVHQRVQLGNGKTKSAISKLPFVLQLESYILIFAILTPVFIILGAICCVYRTMVQITLWIKHGDKFRGLLPGPDVLWTLEDDSSPIINVLLVVKHDTNEKFNETTMKRLKHIIMQPSMWKMRCRLDFFAGYSYLLRDNAELPLKQLDRASFEHHDDLQTTLSTLSTRSIDSSRLWEAYIASDEISWGTKRKCYPLIVRFHHSLGDGLALLQLLQKCFSNDDQSQLHDTRRFQNDEDDLVHAMIRISIRIMHFFVVCCHMPKVLLEILARVPDSNCMHDLRRNLSLGGEKIVAWKVENGYKYVQRVKAIKRRFPGTGFFDVLAAGVGYSLERCFKLKGNGKCDSVSVVVPAITHERQFISMDANGSFELTNRFTIGVLDLPVFVTHCGFGDRVFSGRCALTTKRLFDLRTSYEFQFNYWLLNIAMGIIPQQILGPILKNSLNISTLIISNLPGPRRIYLNKDASSSIEDIVFWIPQRGHSGVSISVFTYEGRFQLGISIDKTYNISFKEAEMILEHVFDYIDNLYDELAT